MVSCIRGVAIAASCLILTFATGCSVLAAASGQQCEIDDDCVVRGFADHVCVDRVCVPSGIDSGVPPLPPGWECVGTLKPEPPKKPLVQFTVTLTDLIHPEKSVSDAVMVRACRKLDVGCTAPLTMPARPDAGGQARLMVEGGFDGYVEVFPTSQVPVYVPSLIFLGSPANDDVVNMSTPLVSIADLPILVQSTGSGSFDPKLGGVFFRATDCAQSPASGVAGTLDLSTPDTRRFFFVDGLPSESSASTDLTGAGGFINVLLGTRSVRGTRVADSLYFGTVSVLVRPGVFSYVRLSPQPL